MPRNITNRPGTDKAVRNALTASEKLLGDGSKAIRNILDAKEGNYVSVPFSDDEVQQLVNAKELLLRGRLRNEFPIVARVFEDLVDTLKDAKPDDAGNMPDLKLTISQTKAVLELMGDLSFAENEALNRLHQLGIIPQDQWDTAVKPHRQATNDEHTKLGKQAKWGLASFGNMLSPAALAIGVGTAVGGPMGMIGAMGLSTLYAMYAGKKIQGAINSAAMIEGSTLGMNAAQGKQVLSEVVLLAARAAVGDVLVDTNRDNLKERLGVEIELGNMIVNARQSKGASFGAIEQPFIDMAIGYTEGLPGILEKMEKGELDDAGARKALVDLRASVLKPEALDQVTRTILGTFVADRDGQQLIFLRQMSAASTDMSAALKESGGKPTAEQSQMAQALVMLDKVVGQSGVGALSEDAEKLLGKLGAGETLSPVELKAFDTTVAKATKQTLADNEGKLMLTNSEAKGQAKQAFDILWGQVVPSFQEFDEPPVATKMKAVKLDDGNYEVTGAFKGGFLGMGSEGSFKIKVGALGGVDVDSMKVDLGEDFMKGAAKEVVEQYGDFLGDKMKVRHVSVTEQGDGTKPYGLSAKLDDERIINLNISSLGMVDWGSIAVG